jgi:thioredoxin-like negative regulator of GroEL
LLLEKKDLIVLEVDAEKFPRLAQKSEFNVRSVPSLFLFRKGEMTKKVSGNISNLQLKEFIDD